MNLELIKYLTMLQLVSPNTCHVNTAVFSEDNKYCSTSVSMFKPALTSNNFIFPSPIKNTQESIFKIKELVSNQLFYNVVVKFLSDTQRLYHFIEGYRTEALNMFSSAILRIAELTPHNIIIGLTDTHSIYFRIYNENGFETHLETFYTKDENDDLIEAVVTVYQNEKIKLKSFGTLQEVMAAIKNVVKTDIQISANFASYSNFSSTATLEYV